MSAVVTIATDVGVFLVEVTIDSSKFEQPIKFTQLRSLIIEEILRRFKVQLQEVNVPTIKHRSSGELVEGNYSAPAVSLSDDSQRTERLTETSMLSLRIAGDLTG